MCWSCETYDHSRNCGNSCSDHIYEFNELVSDDEMTMLTCSRCGSCKVED